MDDGQFFVPSEPVEREITLNGQAVKVLVRRLPIYDRQRFFRDASTTDEQRAGDASYVVLSKAIVQPNGKQRWTLEQVKRLDDQPFAELMRVFLEVNRAAETTTKAIEEAGEHSAEG